MDLPDVGTDDQQPVQRKLAETIDRVCELQLAYSSANTPEMQERGRLVRGPVADVLRSWVPPDHGLEVTGRDGTGRKTRVPWTRLFTRRLSPSPTQGFYLVYLFAADGSGVVLSLNQGTTDFIDGNMASKDPAEVAANVAWARRLLAERSEYPVPWDSLRLADPKGLGAGYELGNIGAIRYTSGRIPDDAQLKADLMRMVGLLQIVYEAQDAGEGASEPEGLFMLHEVPPATVPAVASLASHVTSSLSSYGFVYEPWQVATFIAAVRTKPFVILAGISGTGKTKLPMLAGRATGADVRVIPVRPDWHDSGDLLGYTDLAGIFRPKPFLKACADAMANPARQYIAVIDEMNIARVEHYFAEVLSRMEEHSLGQACSAPLMDSGGAGFDAYSGVGLPANLAIVGTVNMDDTTHGFSRKVLDRAFTIELSEVDLDVVPAGSGEVEMVAYAPADWRGEHRRLSDRVRDEGGTTPLVDEIVGDLKSLNSVLSRAQLQVGYRSRDEIVLFVVNAQKDEGAFLDSKGARVDPFDLALMMKILPRIAGSSRSVGSVLEGIVRLSVQKAEPEAVVQEWRDMGMPSSLDRARWPRTTARACLMLHRLEDGYTSYFL